jgi:hypothetical protein
MKQPTRKSFIAAALLGLALSAGAATAVQSGGASVEDFAALNREAAQHSLKLVLASKGSGAYLADVDVSVHELPSRRVVLEHRTEGPLMLAKLPPGRYEVVAQYRDVLPGAATRVVRTVSIGRGLTQMVIYFDTGDEVSPDRVSGYSTPQ